MRKRGRLFLKVKNNFMNLYTAFLLAFNFIYGLNMTLYIHEFKSIAIFIEQSYNIRNFHMNDNL